MDSHVPATGEDINAGPPTEPRLAATVMLVRDGDAGLEVLLVQRNRQARFMAGAWVFPGGAVEKGEGEGDRARRAAAARELREEAGIELAGPEALTAFSRWITPPEVKIRFDAWFYLAVAPAGAEPVVDGREVVDWRWYRPEAALAAAREGEILLVFPTIKHLEQLAEFGTAGALLDHARGREVAPVEPRVVMAGETARIVLPGDSGYDGDNQGPMRSSPP